MSAVFDAESKNAIEHLYKESAYLNPALRRIAEYILSNTVQCKTMTIKDLSNACHVAESTVTRFVKELGYNSYQKFKISIAEALTLSDALTAPAGEKYVYVDISRTDSTAIILDKILSRNIQTLTETRQRINLPMLERAVQFIEQSNLIVLSCKGSSAEAAGEAVMQFTRAGKKCLLYRDESVQLMTSSILKSPDVIIGISNSGESTSVIQCLKVAQSNGAKTIAITSFEDSSIVKYADVALFTSTKTSPVGPGYYWESTTAKSAQMFVVDCLYACFASKHIEETFTFLEETYEAIKGTRGI
jgi:RpiR family transcriptional regulator, carbohydrate utilization regulator